MTNQTARTVVREIPAPEMKTAAHRNRSVPHVPVTTVLLFAVGFSIYFGTLVISPSVAGIGIAIGLLLLGVILFVAFAVRQAGGEMTNTSDPLAAPEASVQQPVRFEAPVSPTEQTTTPQTTSEVQHHQSVLT